MITAISIVFLFVPVLLILGFHAFLEYKGINDPTLSITLYRSTIVLDSALKLVLALFISDFETYALISYVVIFSYFLFLVVRISLVVPKISHRKNRKYPQETNYTTCALKVVALGCFSLVLNICLLFSCWSFEDYFMIFFVTVPFVATTVLYMFGIVQTFLRLDRLKYPSIRSLTGLANNNSPVVLLRSFKIDSTPKLDGRVFDETICESLNLTENPIISLANPDEILPSGGSLKIQAKDSEWKEVVKELLINCRAVILVEGRSDGLHWEISKLKEFLSPSQLYVMVPSRIYREIAWCYDDNVGFGVFSITRTLYRYMNIFSRMGNKKILNGVWKEFSEKLNSYGIHTPTKFPGEGSLVSFDSNWCGIKEHYVKDTKSMLKVILEKTSLFNKIDFNYKSMAKKIESFAVNGFLNPKEIEPVKILVKRYAMIGMMASVILGVLFVAYVLQV